MAKYIVVRSSGEFRLREIDEDCTFRADFIKYGEDYPWEEVRGKEFDDEKTAIRYMDEYFTNKVSTKGYIEGKLYFDVEEYKVIQKGTKRAYFDATGVRCVNLESPFKIVRVMIEANIRKFWMYTKETSIETENVYVDYVLDNVETLKEVVAAVTRPIEIKNPLSTNDSIKWVHGGTQCLMNQFIISNVPLDSFLLDKSGAKLSIAFICPTMSKVLLDTAY